MPFIAFLGCDGSGKSAVIEGLRSRLESDGRAVAQGHWRPKALMQSGSGSSKADDPHGQVPRGLFASIAKLGWLWLNWWFGWFSGLSKASRDGYVIFDRYHGDLLVDPKRYRYGGPLWLARLVSRMMPQPDQIYFLDATADVLLTRKNELPMESLEQLRGRYLSFCERTPRCHITDATAPLKEVIESVVEHLKH